MLYFFFFKQKTAYEMRISDWSSDVCSSDLPPLTPFFAPFFVWTHTDPRRPFLSCLRGKQLPRELREQISDAGSRRERLMLLRIVRRELECGGGIELAFDRSEEHTYELQSLMRIQYAVFCLKNKRHDERRIQAMN